MSAEAPTERKMKRANTPFLAQKKYLAAQEKAKQERAASGASEPAPTVSFGGALKWLLIALVANLLLSRMITETWLWTYNGKWSRPSAWLPKPSRPARSIRYFTESELAQYDGSDPAKPVYLALDGSVYDVTAGRRTYGPGGSYHHFAGRDGARAFVTGCFKSHLTHDLRGLDKKQLESLGSWKHFYAESAKYFQVGKVLHQPIDPESPIPEDCNAKSEGGAQ